MESEIIDTVGSFPLQIIKKRELNLRKHFTMEDFMQFYNVVENNFNTLFHEVSELKKLMKSKEFPSETQNSLLGLQDKIYDNLKEFLERNYQNSFVAITYDGKILASDADNVGLLDKLNTANYPGSQVFIRKVGAKAVAGWRLKSE